MKKLAQFDRERAACAYFFVAPALLYGIFTSRLPALKLACGMDDSQIGLLLLALGCATLAGLVICGPVLERVGGRTILALSVLCMMISIVLATFFANNFLVLAIFCMLAGFAVGFCDVAMNAQGICMEKQRKRLCLSFLHGLSSLGAAAGSFSGSCFAAFDLSPFVNAGAVLGAFLLLLPLAWRNTADYRQAPQNAAKRPLPWLSLCFVVYLCGLLNLVCHVAEGSVGNWGSLLLFSGKGASQEEAALVFAAFTSAMVGCRLGADRMRLYVSDYKIIFWGGILAACSMAVVLLSPWPAICLLGYACMGGALAPVAPVLFARAGRAPDVTPAQASGIVSVFSYAGLLVFPPFIGMVGNVFGLAQTLWLIVLLCLCLSGGAVILRRDRV